MRRPNGEVFEMLLAGLSGATTRNALLGREAQVAALRGLLLWRLQRLGGSQAFE
jgi:hypothetical protein